MRRIGAAWEAWKRGARWIGEKQAALVYTLIYFFVVGPIALTLRLVSDPLQYRRRHNPTFWLTRSRGPMTLKEASRQ